MFFGSFRLGLVGVDDFTAGFSGPLGVCFWIFEPVGFVCLTSLSEIRGLVNVCMLQSLLAVPVYIYRKLEDLVQKLDRRVLLPLGCFPSSRTHAV